MKQRLAYVRVSKEDQNPHLQTDAIAAAGCDQVYEEKVSSGKAIKDRPELVNVLRALRPGDTLVVWKLDRLGRSTHELVNIGNSLRGKGIFIELLAPRMRFDDSPIGKAMYAVFAMFAELERDMIRERTLAGLVAAKARGRLGGRRPKLTKKDVREIRAMLTDPEIAMKDIVQRYGVGRATVYRHLLKSSKPSSGLT